MEIKFRPSYYAIVAFYDELDNGGDETSIRKKIGKEIKEKNLDTRLCDLIAKSMGVRSVFKGFHDEELIDFNFDKSDCRMVFRGFNGGYVNCDFDCPYTIKFEGVVDCVYKSATAFTKEPYYCGREELVLLHDGNISVTLIFYNYNNLIKYTPQTVQIICKDVTIFAAPEYKK